MRPGIPGSLALRRGSSFSSRANGFFFQWLQRFFLCVCIYTDSSVFWPCLDSLFGYVYLSVFNHCLHYDCDIGFYFGFVYTVCMSYVFQDISLTLFLIDIVSFCYYVPKLWDSIPLWIKQSDSVLPPLLFFLIYSFILFLLNYFKILKIILFFIYFIIILCTFHFLFYSCVLFISLCLFLYLYFHFICYNYAHVWFYPSTAYHLFLTT